MTSRTPAENILLELLPDVEALRGRELATLDDSPLVSPHVLAALHRFGPDVADLLASAPKRRRLAEEAAARLRRELLLRHPYLEMDAREDVLLVSLLERSMAELAELAELAGLRDGSGPDAADPSALRAAVRRQGHELRRFASERLGLDARAARRQLELDGPVVSSRYTPELQLRLLGLDAGRLSEPILDLGCGEVGALVDHLAELGYDVVGVDRLVEPGPRRRQQSWFDLEVEPAHWGTIISHQAFSLRFVHAHLGSRALAARYARRYRTLLEGLRDGGVFAYAPGLPFIEPHLGADFAVTRQPIPLPDTQIPAAMARLFAPDGLYAVQVERGSAGQPK